jgi:uncharacterized protein
MIRTNRRFFCDVQDHAIHAEVLTELKRRLRHSAAPSEIASWRNSMQFMANILVDQELPATAGVSIEYQLQLSSKRIDFILSGQDAARRETAVIIELKRRRTRWCGPGWVAASRKQRIRLIRRGRMLS